MRRRNYLTAAVTAGVGMSAGCIGNADDGEYPDENFRFIIPHGTGGGVDFWARGVFPTVAENLGVDVEFENITGGAGTRGFAELSEADPDGYTLASCGQGFVEIAHLTNETPYNWTDFETGGVKSDATREVIFANPDFNIESWEDLFSRYESGEVENFGAGDNTGSLSATFAAMQNDGVIPEDTNRVGYDGSGPTVEAVVTGEVPVGIATDTSVSGAGFLDELDVFGTVTEDMSEVISTEELVDPDAPSLAAAGYTAYQRLGQYNYGYYWPEGTPQDRIESVGEALEEAINDPELNEWAEESGNVIGPYVSPSEHEEIRDEAWEAFNHIDFEALENL